MQGLKSGALLRHETYRIEKILGQGGFGITYLATDLALDRLVAIKEFFPKDYCDRVGDTSHITLGTSSSTEFVSRLKAKFLKEARNIAKLDHPGIIKIHAAFEENNTAYYVMDYIKGESLSDKVKRQGPLSLEVALKYIEGIGSALEYIHTKHINHLDLKPANVMVRESDDIPILIDFGLSKQYDLDGNQTSTTPTGISHGFAPLEQYNDGGVKEFSPQTDIYSLAATLYYLVSGIVPPHATKMIEDGIQFPPSFPQSLIQAISIGMASARKNRYSSVTLFLNALDGEDESTEFTEAANGQEVAPSEPTIQNTLSSPKTASRKSHRSNRFLWIALIVVGIVVSVGGPSLLVKSCDRTPDSNNEDTALPADSVVAVEEAKVVEVVQNRTLSTALGECSYSGEVDENGKPNGHGVAVWTKGDGKKYDGEWVNGNMEGQTTYTQRSGDMFVGTFKNNRYHQGRYTIISSGEYFEGTFKNGQPDKGNWYDKNGKKL
ncbi:MAG TPA: hypothetical protein DD424_01800 [Porphyromonadaceae bacterium]|nr:hypothetical protein [Porphyromonadaceae bacterium]